MNKAIKYVGYISGVAILLTITYSLYLYITYIDNIVLEGSAYGYNIGDSKKDVYMRAKDIHERDSVYIVYPKGSYGTDAFKKIIFSTDDAELFFKEHSWKFYYGITRKNFIELTFENNKLLSIYRRRQNFELP